MKRWAIPGQSTRSSFRVDEELVRDRGLDRCCADARAGQTLRRRRRSKHLAAAVWALGTSVLGGSAYASPSANVTARGGTLTEQPQRRPDRSAPDYRLVSALGLAGTYAALGTWMWFAWYADKPRLPQWRYGGDGWFGSRRYAGGADKLGHVWTNLALSRLGTELLRQGGWNAWPSSLISAGICLSAFLLVEVNDGFYTEFSPGDLSANLLGAGAATAMSNWRALDDAVDLRVQWFPSAEFRRQPGADVAEDYSGQTYLLAYKPRSIAAVRASRGGLGWLQFVNPVVGFESRNYKPPPPNPEKAPRRQTVFVGVALDMQAVIDATLEGRSSRAARWGHATGHALFEVFNLPSSTLPLVSLSRETVRGRGR